MQRAFLAGLGAVVLILAVISYMKSTIKDKEDIPEMLDTVELATLYHESKYKDIKSFLKRKEKNIILTDPNVSFGFGETIKKMRTKIIYQMKKKGVKIIYVASTMDGEGKTTFALNLAEVMSQKYKNVLLIEGDSAKCDLKSKLGIEKNEAMDWGRGFREGSRLTDYIIPAGKHKFKAMVNLKADTFSSDNLASEKMKAFLK